MAAKIRMRAIFACIPDRYDRVGIPCGEVPCRGRVDLLWSPLFGRKEWIVRCEEWLVDVIRLSIPHPRHPLKLSDCIDYGGRLSKTNGNCVKLRKLAQDRPVDGSIDAMDIGRLQDADHDSLRHMVGKPGVRRG